MSDRREEIVAAPGQRPFTETIRGLGSVDVCVRAEDGVSIALVPSWTSATVQAHVGAEGVRMLIEALETAEQHLSLVQRGRVR